MTVQEELAAEPEPFTGRMELPTDSAKAAFISEYYNLLYNRIAYPAKDDPEPTPVEQLTATVLDRVLTIGSAETADFAEEAASDEASLREALSIADEVCQKAWAGQSSVPAEE